MQQFGFRWGPARVTRIATWRSGKRETWVIGINSDHHAVEVSVSRTGRSVRVWLDGKEMKP